MQHIPLLLSIMLNWSIEGNLVLLNVYRDTVYYSLNRESVAKYVHNSRHKIATLASVLFHIISSKKR